MTNDDYSRGFSDVSKRYGVDPSVLAKVAELDKQALITDLTGAYVGRKIVDGAKWLYNRGPAAIGDVVRGASAGRAAGRMMRENGLTNEDIKNFGPYLKSFKAFMSHPAVKTMRNGLNQVSGWYNGLSPDARRGVNGLALTGLGTMLFSNGSFMDRLVKALGYGAAGGLATYGASRTGVYDAAKNETTKYLKQIAEYLRQQRGTSLGNYDAEVKKRQEAGS